jgi:hypothetical protein
MIITFAGSTVMRWWQGAQVNSTGDDRGYPRYSSENGSNITVLKEGVQGQVYS